MNNAINLNQKLVYKGFWYLSSAPDKKVAGILTYYPNEKIELELIGGFDNFMDSLFNVDEESVIYGRTENAKDVTLLQNVKSFSVNSSAGFPIINYECSYMIIGKLINSLEEKCRYKAYVRIPELSYWSFPDAIDATMQTDKNGNFCQAYISCESKCQNENNIISKVQINDNTFIQLKKFVKWGGNRLNYHIEQYTYLQIIKQEAISINELLSDIHFYEQFLSLATLSVSKASEITIIDEDVFQQIATQKYYTPIHIICPFKDRLNLVSNIKWNSYLFDYSAIKEIYPNVLKKWYNVPKELYPIRTHLVDSLAKKKIYSSEDFLIVIQAVEGFWWRFRETDYRVKNNIPIRKKTTLEKILKELIFEFKDIELLKKRTIDVVAVIGSRHYYSHLLSINRKMKVLDGMALKELTDDLRILLICCVLSFIGVEKFQINVILNKSNSNFLK